MTNTRPPFIQKPKSLEKLEQKLSKAIPLNPNMLSSIKLFVITPLILLSFNKNTILPDGPILPLGLFALFCLMDYLDGIVARVRSLSTPFGEIYDRFTDYPLLLILSFQCISIIPTPLLLTKLGLDLLLYFQFLLGKGPAETRFRTSINYSVLIILLLLSQGLATDFINPDIISTLFYINILFNIVVFTYNLNIFHRNYIADLLSFSNMCCGFFSIYFAYLKRFDISLILLMLGAAFDGFDGAAARKWGGTRWGVYSDDIADGVNYGIAPGVAIYFSQGGWEGAVTGFFYSFFTISRLVFFTLNKGESDPNFFQGVPSTGGGLIVLCSLIIFSNSPLIIGLFTGIACAQMVSFNTYYRHLGRALGSGQKRYAHGIPAGAVFLLIGYFFWGMDITIGLLLTIILVYGFAPVFKAFREAYGK